MIVEIPQLTDLEGKGGSQLIGAVLVMADAQLIRGIPAPIKKKTADDEENKTHGPNQDFKDSHGEKR
jgi:hypothetical protein